MIDDLLPRLRATPDDPAFVGRRGVRVTRGELADRALAVAAAPARAAASRTATRSRSPYARVRRRSPWCWPPAAAAAGRAGRPGGPARPADRAAAGRRGEGRRHRPAGAGRGRLGRAAGPPGRAAPGPARRDRPGARAPAPAPRRAAPPTAPATATPRRWSSSPPAPPATRAPSCTRPPRSRRARAGHRPRRRRGRGDRWSASTFFAMAPALLAGAPVATRARPPHRSRRCAPQLTYVTPPQARDLLDAGTRFTGRVFAGSAPVSARLLERLRDAGSPAGVGGLRPDRGVPGRRRRGAHQGGLRRGRRRGRPGRRPRARHDRAHRRRPARCSWPGAGAAARYLGGAAARRGARPATAATVDGRRRGVVLHGRLKDMVLRGAENIYPGLHEPSLQVPGVAQALLVGVPGDDLDERLVLVVEPEPGRLRGRGPPAPARPGRRPRRRPGPDDVVVARIPTQRPVAQARPRRDRRGCVT